MLAGGPPFLADSFAELSEQIRLQMPAALGEVRSDIPPNVEAICTRCLQKSPQERYPTALALAEDLRRALKDRPLRLEDEAYDAPSLVPKTVLEQAPDAPN